MNKVDPNLIAALNLIANDTTMSAAAKKRATELLKSSAENILSIAEREQKARDVELQQRIAVAKQQEKLQRETRKKCSHRKLNPLTGQVESFLRGQYMQDGRLVLMCQNEVCQKTFSDPPSLEQDWDAIPPDLIPNEFIGGVIDQRQALQMTRNGTRSDSDRLNDLPPAKN